MQTCRCANDEKCNAVLASKDIEHRLAVRNFLYILRLKLSSTFCRKHNYAFAFLLYPECIWRKLQYALTVKQMSTRKIRGSKKNLQKLDARA